MRESLDMSRGEMTIFLTRPITLALLLVAATIIAVPAVQALRRKPGPLANRPREDVEV
jgi:putative tricarboxylic transport membrane protein